jgi:hypothetical protein
MRYVELRRHTDNEADRLTPQGAADAERIGRDGLHPPYAAFVSTGAARATQMLAVSDSRPVRANEAVHRAVGGPRRGLPGHDQHRGASLRGSLDAPTR